MCRSYKKKPWMCDRNPWAKREANKRVRRYKKTIVNGNAYRKITNPWDICDYKWRETLFECLEDKKLTSYCHGGRLFEREPYDEKKEIKNWKKYHYRK